MDLKRRLKLYLFGLIIGGLLAWTMYGDRLTNAGWTPAERIKLRLVNTLVKATPSASDTLTRWGMTLDRVRGEMPDAQVLMDRVEHRGDSILYTVQLPAGPVRAEAVIAVNKDHRADSTATLLRIRSR